MSQYQFLHRDPSGISGKFPGNFPGISGKFLGNFPDPPLPPDNPPPTLYPTTTYPPTPPHPPDFKWVFLEKSKVIKSDIFYPGPSSTHVCITKINSIFKTIINFLEAHPQIETSRVNSELENLLNETYMFLTRDEVNRYIELFKKTVDGSVKTLELAKAEIGSFKEPVNDL